MHCPSRWKYCCRRGAAILRCFEGPNPLGQSLAVCSLLTEVNWVNHKGATGSLEYGQFATFGRHAWHRSEDDIHARGRCSPRSCGMESLNHWTQNRWVREVSQMYVFRDTKWHDQSDMRDVSLAKRERERENNISVGRCNARICLKRRDVQRVDAMIYSLCQSACGKTRRPRKERNPRSAWRCD